MTFENNLSVLDKRFLQISVLPLPTEILFFECLLVFYASRLCGLAWVWRQHRQTTKTTTKRTTATDTDESVKHRKWRQTWRRCPKNNFKRKICYRYNNNYYFSVTLLRSSTASTHSRKTSLWLLTSFRSSALRSSSRSCLGSVWRVRHARTTTQQTLKVSSYRDTVTARSLNDFNVVMPTYTNRTCTCTCTCKSDPCQNKLCQLKHGNTQKLL